MDAEEVNRVGLHRAINNTTASISQTTDRLHEALRRMQHEKAGTDDLRPVVAQLESLLNDTTKLTILAEEEKQGHQKAMYTWAAGSAVSFAAALVTGVAGYKLLCGMSAAALAVSATKTYLRFRDVGKTKEGMYSFLFASPNAPPNPASRSTDHVVCV